MKEDAVRSLAGLPREDWIKQVVQNNRVYSKKHYPGALNYWTFPTIEPDNGDVAHHPFVAEIAHFIECIENDVESHASIRDTYGMAHRAEYSIAIRVVPARSARRPASS